MKLTNKSDTATKISISSNIKERSANLEDIVNNRPKGTIISNKPEALPIKRIDIEEESMSVDSSNENQIPTNDSSQIGSQNIINKPEILLFTQNIPEKLIVAHNNHQYVSSNSYDLRTQPDSQEDSYSPNSNSKKLASYLNDPTIKDSNEDKSIDIEEMINEEIIKARELNLNDVEKLIEYNLFFFIEIINFYKGISRIKRSNRG